MRKYKKIKISRITMLGMIFLALAAILVVRLYRLQITDGKKYADNFVLKTKREILQKGVRGNIYDRNGKTLARNELVYTVTLADSETYRSNRERQLALNGKIFRLITIIEKNGGELEEYLNIGIKEGKYTFTKEGTALDRFRADVYGKKTIKEMTRKESGATAEQMMREITGEKRFCLYSEGGKTYSSKEKETYGLPEVLTKEQCLKISNIRYALSLQAYRKYLAVTVSENVSDETVAEILENQEGLEGTEIKEDTIRVYDGGEACASVTGYTGRISSEELEEKKDENYTLDSVVGKTGMEQYLEEYLRGKDGKKEILVDNMGRIIGETGENIEAEKGKDVYLTIDLDLQKKTYQILEQKIADVLLENTINAKTFDKESVYDASDIKITIYEIYCALFANHVIDTERFEKEGASSLERRIFHKQQKEKEMICNEIQRFLEKKEDETADKKRREYEGFLLENADLISEPYEKEAEKEYERWKTGKDSIQKYLNTVIAKGWVRADIFKGEEKYLTQDEMYKSVAAYLIQFLKDSGDFDKIVYQTMVMEDKISSGEIISLLYKQGVLKKKGEDYQRWEEGDISDYEFMRAKIKNLEITPADLALDPCSGSAVVTDTKTGEVLACVSYPGYDNNCLANHMDSEYYYSLSANASLPLYNRATQQLSAPGSTFKPLTIIAGLEEKVIQPDTTVICDGVFDKVSPSLRCWNRSGHGAVTSAAAALRHSCNDYLCETSYRLGRKGNKEFSDEQALGYLQKYAKMFHMDEKSGVELTESSPHITDQYAVPSAIGQGTNNFSTVQMGRYVNTLANGGKSYKLTLIKQIGKEKRTFQPESEIRLSQNTWNNVHKGMELYAESTGIFENYEISAAGKSGTAQESKTRPDHGLFIGYAPAKNPEISLAVRIVNGYTSENAVACGREIFSAYFNG